MSRKDEAKKADLVSVLAQYGERPKKSHGAYVWFLSPFRRENEPSFIVDLRKNRWKDFGDGESGDVFDFVMRYEGCGFSEAISKILGDEDKVQKEFDPTEFKAVEHGIDIIDVGEITNHGLIKYSKSRGIDIDLLRKYCKQISYIFKGSANRENIAIGFENHKGGWELRNQNSKVGNSPKSWSLVRGKYMGGADVFEGFFDFLSHLQYNGFDEAMNDSYILNSLVFTEWIVEDLNEYDIINLYLDNDAPAQEKMGRYFTGDNKFNDCRGVYPLHEDYNAFLMDTVFNK